jgi:hypothetical protein
MAHDRFSTLYLLDGDSPRPAPALLAAVLSALMRLTSYVLVPASSIHLHVLLPGSRMRQ